MIVVDGHGGAATGAVYLATQAGEWRAEAEPLEDLDQPWVGSPRLAVNAAGKAVLVCTKPAPDGVATVYARHFDGNTWGMEQLLRGGDQGASGPQVGIDGSGNALAAWSQSTPAGTRVYYARFNAVSSTWSDPLPARSELAYSSPQLAMDASGNAFAVWTTAGSGSYSLLASRFTPASGAWAAPTTLVTISGSFLTAPALAMNAAGDAAVVWARPDLVVQAWRWPAASGAWTGSAILQAGSNYSTSVDLALSSGGRAAATWVNATSTYASRFNGSAWSSPTLLASGTDAPRVAIEGSGNATVVWASYDGSASSLYASRYTTSTDAWGAATAIESLGTSLGGARIGIDAAGTATVAVRTTGATGTTYTLRRDPSGTWGAATFLFSGSSSVEQLALDGTGRAFVVQLVSGSANVAVSRTNGAGSATTDYAESSEGSVFASLVAAGPVGGAVALFAQRDGPLGGLFSRARDPVKGGWGPIIAVNPQRLQSPMGLGAAMGPQGEVVAAWTSRGATWELHPLRSSPASGTWSQAPAVAFGTAVLSVDSPKVGAGTAGEVIAWRQAGQDGRWHAVATTSTGAAWSAPVPLESSAQGLAADVGLATGGGSSVAAWFQAGASSTDLVVRVLAGGAWSAPRTVASTTSTSVSPPQPGLDGQGGAAAVWAELSGGAWRVFASRTASSTAPWEAAVRIDDGRGGSDPRLGVDQAGDATAVWAGTEDGVARVFANRYETAQGLWGEPVRLNPGGAAGSSPALAVDALGVVTVAWSETGTPWILRARRHLPGFGWSGLLRLAEGATGSVSLGAEPEGRVVAVFRDIAAPTSALANVYE